MSPRTLILRVAPTVALVAINAFAGTNRVITTAAELRAVTYDNPQKDMPFDIVAEVTFPHRAYSGSFAITDDSGATDISDERPDREDNRIRAGDIIRVKGITDDTALGVIYAGCRSVEILSRKKAGAPAEASAADILAGRYDHRTVRIKGFIRDSFRDEIDPNVTFLILVSGGETIYVALPGENGPEESIFSRFVGADVEVTGLCRTSAHGTRRQIGRLIKAESIDYVKTLSPSAKDPFDVPDIHIPSGLRAPELSVLGRRRAAGHVIAVWSGDGDSALLKTASNRYVRVEIADGNPPRYGQHIEVAGFPETDLYNINLSRAIWRPLPETHFADETPTNVTAAGVMFDKRGLLHINTALHGHAICIRGIVRGVPSATTGNLRLMVESDGCMVPVDVSSVPDAMHGIIMGCEIEASGTCVMDIENWHPNSVFPHVKGFTVVARTPSDVKVMSWPPWWTPERLMVVVGALLAALAGIFIWNRSLNRLAERRGRELSEESVAHIAADLKVGERTRLAIELHDSLSQNLTGVSLEVATAAKFAERDPAITLQHLDMAARSLKSCRDELRNCIWDLRNYALDESDMNEAVRRTLGPYVSGTELVVRFNVPRKLLPDNTAHALLRIIRELVQNAIRHGRAKTVKVAGCLEGERLLFSVSDDGCGFDPENHPGMKQGHFGLQGIRERVNQFGGEMSIESETGKGTKISISLTVHDMNREKEVEANYHENTHTDSRRPCDGAHGAKIPARHRAGH